MKKQISFKRCKTCGRFLPNANSDDGDFCGSQCKKAYTRCPVCHRYFSKESDLQQTCGNPDCEDFYFNVMMKEK